MTLQGFSHALLSSLFDYDPLTGVVTRRVSVSGRGTKCQAGSEVGSVDGKGYLHVMVRGKFIRLHRLAFFLAYKRTPDLIDHVDCDRVNNRLVNLRPSNPTRNAGNARKCANNKSGFRGVSQNSRSGKWHAQIKLNGKQTYLGRFDSPQDAAVRYNLAAVKHFGESARLNHVE